MKIDISGKNIDLVTLRDELESAGLPWRGLGTRGVNLTRDGEGSVLIEYEWPKEAQDVVDAHVPPPPQLRKSKFFSG